MSNSEVKRLSADGSVGSPHVRVGHRQAFIKKTPLLAGFFVCALNTPFEVAESDLVTVIYTCFRDI